jgi:hypothetical protein
MLTPWVAMQDLTPVMDFGPNDCAGGMASSHWSDFRLGQPDPGLWETQVFAKGEWGRSTRGA